MLSVRQIPGTKNCSLVSQPDETLTNPRGFVESLAMSRSPEHTARYRALPAGSKRRILQIQFMLYHDSRRRRFCDTECAARFLGHYFLVEIRN